MTNNGADLRLQSIKSEITIVKNTIRRYKYAAIIAISIAILSLLIFWCIFYFQDRESYKYLLDIGSISGGVVSSLFSLSGLILVYVAFLGQKQQLLNQETEMLYNKEELKLTRIELHNQQAEMRQQNDTLKLQNFENTFFQLLSNYQKNISLFYVIMDKNLFYSFRNYYRNFIPEKISVISNEILIDSFKRAIKEDERRIIDYAFLNQIKTIIKIIENSEINEKEYYYDILRNVFSRNEKECIYIILNFDENLNIEIKELFEKHNILLNFNMNPSFFITSPAFF